MIFLDSCSVLVSQMFLVHSFQHTPLQVRLLLDSEIFSKESIFFSWLIVFWYQSINWFQDYDLFEMKIYPKKIFHFLWMSNAGSFSRSAVNHESGAKSGVSGIVSGIIITCTLLFLTPLFEYIPQVCFQVFIGHMSFWKCFSWYY